MKKYKIMDIDGSKILQAEEETRILYIPLNTTNSDYREYLRYTAWVEAGNTPEDFWTQDDELIEPSEPKEEEETTEGES